VVAKAKPFDPVAPPYLELKEIAALKAVSAGTALEHQQQLAMRVIVEKICRRYEDPYCPGRDGERDSVFAMGRMRAGTILTSFLNADLAKIRDPDAPPREIV
jgi:hypothetical protein